MRGISGEGCGVGVGVAVGIGVALGAGAGAESQSGPEWQSESESGRKSGESAVGVGELSGASKRRDGSPAKRSIAFPTPAFAILAVISPHRNSISDRAISWEAMWISSSV